MNNQKPAPAMRPSPRLYDRPMTAAVEQTHNRADGFTNMLISLFMAGTLLLALSACISDSSSVDSVAAVTKTVNAPDGQNSYEEVDCLLPGQIRRLGTQLTYVTERQSVRTTKEDCIIRGGEAVLGK